jgi:LytS/YehU family sensor histidine kinase
MKLKFQDRKWHWIILGLIILMGCGLILDETESIIRLWLTRGINILAILFIVFFNLNYLIPKYLQNSGWLKYLMTVIIFLLIFSPLRIVYLYFLFDNSPLRQQVILNDQSMYFLSDFLVIISSTLIKLSADWVWNQQRLSKLEKQSIQSEIKFLKAQINPHFLFNTLNNIYALSLKKDPNTPDVILKLSGILRFILYECNEKEVPLISEWKYIHDYVDLERLRHSGEINIELNAFIGNKEFKIAPLILMTFVENAFKHGLREINNRSFIHINLYQNDDDLLFDIVNSIPDNSESITRERRGIGLENIKKRLNLLYLDQYNLNVVQEEKQYSIELKIHKHKTKT